MNPKIAEVKFDCLITITLITVTSFSKILQGKLLAEFKIYVRTALCCLSVMAYK